MSPYAYEHTAENRAAWVAAIVEAAADTKPHHAYATALAAYWAKAAPGEGNGAPTPDGLGLTGITWKIECALSADFAAIHAKQLRGHGSYGREYTNLRDKAKRAVGRRRFLDRIGAEAQAVEDAANPLEAALTLDTEPAKVVILVALVTPTKGQVVIEGTGIGGIIFNDAKRGDGAGAGWSAEDLDGRTLAVRRRGATNAAIACARLQGVEAPLDVQVDEEYRRTGARD
ncbi:hypothetical protein ACFQ7N_36920 [Streptomyces niveus]|uniref:hypothetical protein n=1 Tax=Streptomyces niveus TaxID=193462 RepID=UPI00369CD802